MFSIVTSRTYSGLAWSKSNVNSAQPRDRSFRLERFEVKVLLGDAHLGVGHLEHGREQLFLGVEVVEDQPLGDVGARGDGIGIAAGEAVLGEFRERDLQDLALGALPVAPPHRRRFCVLRDGLFLRSHPAVRSSASGQACLPLPS